MEKHSMTSIQTTQPVVIINKQTASRAAVINEKILDPVTCIIKSLMVDLLKEKLNSGVAHFIFWEKSDSTYREAWGTLKPELIASHISGQGKQRKADCQIYWDIERGGFRSFCIENLVKVF